MTATIEETAPVVEDEDTKGAESDSTDDDDDDKDGRSRDFSKCTEKHKELAEFINQNEDFKKADLGVEVTGNLVKAVLALRTDFTNTPEQIAARAERKRIREMEKQKYAGLSPEQIKAAKAAERAQKQAEKLQQRYEEALAKAQALREGRDASGEDVAAAVEAAVGDSKPEPKRKIGRR